MSMAAWLSVDFFFSTEIPTSVTQNFFFHLLDPLMFFLGLCFPRLL